MFGDAGSGSGGTGSGGGNARSPRPGHREPRRSTPGRRAGGDGRVGAAGAATLGFSSAVQGCGSEPVPGGGGGGGGASFFLRVRGVPAFFSFFFANRPAWERG